MLGREGTKTRLYVGACECLLGKRARILRPVPLLQSSLDLVKGLQRGVSQTLRKPWKQG